MKLPTIGMTSKKEAKKQEQKQLMDEDIKRKKQILDIYLEQVRTVSRIKMPALEEKTKIALVFFLEFIGKQYVREGQLSAFLDVYRQTTDPETRANLGKVMGNLKGIIQKGTDLKQIALHFTSYIENKYGDREPTSQKGEDRNAEGKPSEPTKDKQKKL